MKYDENYDHVLDDPANILKFEDVGPNLPNSSTNRYRGKTKLNPFLYTDIKPCCHCRISCHVLRQFSVNGAPRRTGDVIITKNHSHNYDLIARKSHLHLVMELVPCLATLNMFRLVSICVKNMLFGASILAWVRLFS